MRHVLFIFIILTTGITLAGCAPFKASPESITDSVELTGSWRVEDIDQGGVIDFSMTTLRFEEADRISGSTGCNRYSAAVDTDKNAFLVSQAVTTRMACSTAIAMQEQRFLNALNDATRYQIESDTWLVIYDKADKPRLKLISMSPQPEPRDLRSDPSSEQ